MRRPTGDEVTVFPTPAAFGAWLEKNHAAVREFWVGYYRKGAGKVAMTYPEAVEEALCFGWIDGITYRIDDEVYATRMTPRRRGSNWSAANVERVARLTQAGRMRPAGFRAFEERDPDRDSPSLLDIPQMRELSSEFEARLAANPSAWAYWQARPAAYRRAASLWVNSARKAATRERRLASLITDSAAGRPVKPLAPGQTRDR